MVESLVIKVIPDSKRSAPEQQTIKDFKASITSFDELPDVMAKATALMGIDGKSSSGPTAGAFARDVLSVEIEGPSRPQLTLVDLPGLIQTKTKGVTDADIEMVNEITDHYISQPRTICLAVISATNDYANQGILTKVRNVDPDGERTLGVITKPDRLIAGSGMEDAFISLAQNEDIFFKLGWHVLKNRSFDEAASSFIERNLSEDSFFRRSNFKVLPADSVGIDSLRNRLSQLLFNHVKQELPKLRNDLETALSDSENQYDVLGKRRSTSVDCKDYLVSLSLEFYDVCKAAVNGHYQGSYFTQSPDKQFSLTSPASIRRLRAVVQMMNTRFSDDVRNRGHKYYIDRSSMPDSPNFGITHSVAGDSPIRLSKSKAIEWAHEALVRTRGTELLGNFNPLVIGELFWEQSTRWRRLALDHVDNVATACSQFLEILLRERCPKDVHSRLWPSQIQDALKSRKDASVKELDYIWEDLQHFPINYNHYYTDVVKKQQMERTKDDLSTAIKQATTHVANPGCSSTHTSAIIDVDLAVREFSRNSDPDMDKISCEEALDCLLAIYKVQQKTFIANVTTQVVERHIVRGLETIFCPVSVNSLPEAKILGIASEPPTTRKQRSFLEDRIKKLNGGHAILRGVMGSAVL
ncbi:dynamin family protein-like protein [Truncatella angustata]|uniref:Dynamin family protein-like protein n=1 Tax=Truncatella angustata TaxID=152316 RepID=A0A9P8UJE8_9PEZI|nr:dynamin family protein-like protein [Truncatella angustata]KAH6653292.1 dynamin family protein-like protein [Truncatella angustata]